MGYQDRAAKSACGKCGREVLWHWESWVRPYFEKDWYCRCGARNWTGCYDEWPPVPRTLYVGSEKHQQLKLYPFPPEVPRAPWAQPYSIRSFVQQASRRLGGCLYETSEAGEVMGERVFSDRCVPSDASPYVDASHSCHMVAGWTIGEASCPLWERVAALCDTEIERRFLHWYLGLAKDRQFPMLIPQARIGIAERRRPDFVLFVPLQYWKYNWYAIQLDKAHSEDMAADELRDADIAMHGYRVIRLKPEATGYYEEVRGLVERIESEMKHAESDPWSVAVEVPVERFEEGEEEPPF